MGRRKESAEHALPRGTKAVRHASFGAPPNGTFNTVAELAARRCGTAIAIVNVDVAVHPRPKGWQRTILGGPVSTSVFVRDGGLSTCPDAAHLSGPAAALAHDVPFYAAVPIGRPDGPRLGTLAVAHDSPCEIDASAIADLKLMARLVADSIELRASVEAALAAH